VFLSVAVDIPFLHSADFVQILAAVYILRPFAALPLCLTVKKNQFRDAVRTLLDFT
jgi:hypothetical protein